MPLRRPIRPLPQQPTSFERGGPYFRRDTTPARSVGTTSPRQFRASTPRALRCQTNHLASVHLSGHSHNARATVKPFNRPSPVPMSRQSPASVQRASATTIIHSSPPSSPIIEIDIRQQCSPPSKAISAESQNRLQKLASKRDRRKQAKEDKYALDPTLVQVVPSHACARCKSQKWKCYIPGDPDSARRTCLPCGKNKCTFGGAKKRPPTLPLAVLPYQDIFMEQQPLSRRNALKCYQAKQTNLTTSRNSPQPPPLRILSFDQAPATFGNIPQLSPSAISDPNPSPTPCTPKDSYFFYQSAGWDQSPEDSTNQHYRAVSVDVESDHTETIPRHFGERNYIPRLQPIYGNPPSHFPSPEELLMPTEPTSPHMSLSYTDTNTNISSPPSSPFLRNRSCYGSSLPANFSNMSSLSRPSSPPQSPSPDSVSNNFQRGVALPPLSRSPRSDELVPTRHSPTYSSYMRTGHDTPAEDLHALLVECAERSPTDPRPMRIAECIPGRGGEWSTSIEIARRRGESRIESNGKERHAIDFIIDQHVDGLRYGNRQHIDKNVDVAFEDIKRSMRATFY